MKTDASEIDRRMGRKTLVEPSKMDHLVLHSNSQLDDDDAFDADVLGPF